MSILTRPIGKPKAPKAPKNAPAAEDTTPGAALVATAPSRAKAGPAPALALSPRANLLPPEIGENHKRRAVRRGLRFIIVAAVLVAVLGTGGAWYYSFSAQQGLAEAQTETQRLAAEHAKYADVAKTITGIAAGKAAVHVGGGTDIDWSAYLTKLQATLPAGVTLTNVDIESADSQSGFQQSTIPLEGQRIATLTFEAATPTLPSIPDWINSLSGLPGFVDASPNNVQQGADGYTAGVTMHIDTDAYSNRFNPDASKGGDK
jgi:Tfp pilus assembly protein PilN